MIVGLDELKEGIKKKQMQEFAVSIVKYQKFKTSVAISKISYDCSDKTKQLYFDAGRKYIRDKSKVKYMPETLYEFIDEALERCVTPLTPSKQDEHKVYKRDYSKKNAVPPVAKLEILQNKITSNCDYGVQLSSSEIKLCKNRDFALGFVEGLKHTGNTEAKVITIVLGDINERV